MANDTATSELPLGYEYEKAVSDLPFGLTRSYDASLYPSDLSQDLAEHYSVSQQMAENLGGAGSWGAVPSALAGVAHEALNFIPSLWGAGSPGGFSLDDLAANYGGYIGATPEQAGEAGLFEHAEPTDYAGLGQGTFGATWDKIRALHGIMGQEGSESFVMPESGLDAQGRTISPVSTAPGYGVPEGYEVIGTSPQEQLAYVVQDAWRGEAPQALEGIFPGGQPPILPEQPFVRGSLGYNVRDETARLAALASGRLSEYGDFDISPEVQSQSAQALIRSFTENPEVASLVSREGDRRAAVEEALETYLPSAMGIYDDPAQFQEPLAEARKGIMDLIGVPEYGLTPPYDEGWSQRRMLEEPVARSPGEEYVTHRQEIADLKNVEHDYSSDLANWNRSQQGTSDDSDVAEAKYNVMKHLNIVFGSIPTREGTLEPDASAEEYGRRSMHHAIINTPVDYARDFVADRLDSPSTIQKALDNLSGQDQRVEVMDSLTDMANNDTFRTLREEGVSKEEAYKSEDVVWDQREMRDLAQELINNDRDQDAPTITVENVKEEAKKASKKRTDVREEARKPKKKEAKKPKVTKTAVAKALVSKAPPRRVIYTPPPKKKKAVPGYGKPPTRPGGR